MFHRGGDSHCDGPALSIKKMQGSFYELPADNVVKLDGTQPQREEYIFCGSCNKPVHAWELTPQ